MSRRILVAALLGAAALGAVPASANPLAMCYKVFEPVNGGVYTICPEDYIPI